MARKGIILVFIVLPSVINVCAGRSLSDFERNRIKPYVKNPRYWQYKGKPVVLVGGTKEDNLFQIPDLKEHLDLLRSVGGNYIRNTMSSRDSGNVFPFSTKNGKYDLNSWNDEYWDRLNRLLELTYERDIIVQLEVWATWDLIRSHWQKSPYHPDNNINYTSDDTTLKDNYEGVHWKDCDQKQDFFLSVPTLANDTPLLKHQQKFVDKLISYTLRYPNVLYCMTNEIFNQYPPDWGWYWAKYIKAKAEAEGRNTLVTEMYQNHDIINGVNHKASLDHPEIYDFVDISQNAANRDQQHWDNLRHIHSYISDTPRPINHVKTYGGTRDGSGLERFWRSYIGGAASIRFHRPDSGLGLNQLAQNSLITTSKISSVISMWEMDAHMELLSERQSDEAYLAARPGEKYLIYFTNEGGVRLNMEDVQGEFVLKWINISKGQWRYEQPLEGGQKVELSAPARGGWIAVILKR